MNLTVLSPDFPLIWSVFVDLDVFKYCSIEINGDKEKASRIFCQCRRSVYGPVATMTVMWLFSFNLQIIKAVKVWNAARTTKKFIFNVEFYADLLKKGELGIAILVVIRKLKKVN